MWWAARLRLQLIRLSLIDGFYLVAWVSVIALVLVALLRQPPLRYGDLSGDSTANKTAVKGGEVMRFRSRGLGIVLFASLASLFAPSRRKQSRLPQKITLS